MRLLRIMVLAAVMTMIMAPLAGAAPPVAIPILLYHRFGPTIADSMTVTTADFEASLAYLQARGLTVIPLRQLVDYFLGKGPAPPLHSVVITVDDGHRSIYAEMFPLIRKYRVPVTLFIYPSAISNASYALTWEQLREMQKSGLIDCQSHTLWHPNFKKEKKRLAPAEFDKFVARQLGKAKSILEKKLGEPIDLLAWAFGIYDEELIRHAVQAGYAAAFTMDRRLAGPGENIMTLPRFLISGRNADQQLQGILGARP